MQMFGRVVHYYIPVLDKNEDPLKPSYDVMHLRKEEPDVPNVMVKISVVRTESRFVHERTDPASRRKEKVKAIRKSLGDLWKAFKK